MIVSDDPQLIEPLVKVAAKQKMQVETAINTAAARRAIATSNPDLVLLDLGNGTNDSLTLLMELSNRMPPVPTLVFTRRTVLQTG